MQQPGMPIQAQYYAQPGQPMPMQMQMQYQQQPMAGQMQQ